MSRRYLLSHDAHELSYRLFRGKGFWSCSCGGWGGRTGAWGRKDANVAHEEHVREVKSSGRTTQG